MPRKATWPRTVAERQDRDVVVELVQRAGTKKLVWTVYDVRAELAMAPHLTLATSSELSRHIHALDKAFVTAVDKRLDCGVAQKPGSASKARHQFVLTRRLAELWATVPELDDLERVYAALHVAVAALGVDEVPTQAVTNVLRNVEELALITPRNTQNHLMSLFTRNQRLADRRADAGQRWAMWAPVGPAPSHPHFQQWVEDYRRTAGNGKHVVGTGKATLNAMAHELVELTVERLKSAHWPAGRPVQVSDLRAVAGEDTRAAELTAAFRERNRTVASVLGDATKQRIAGRIRVHHPVVKLSTGPGEGSYYDVPDMPGFERRRLFITYKALQAELEDYRIEQIVSEHRAALTFAGRHGSDVVRLIGAFRVAAAAEQLKPAEILLHKLDQQSALLSNLIRRSLDEYRGKLADAKDLLAVPQEQNGRLAEDAARLGLDPSEVLNADRPLLTPQQYVEFVTADLRGLTPAEFLHRAVALRRFPNPNFTSQTDSDPSRSARYCVDRPEAICYLAERSQARTFPFLREGLRVLGRDLRHPALPMLLTRSARGAERHAGLAALVLLAYPGAVDVALGWLRADSPLADTVHALQALLVFRRVDPAEWPDRIRSARERGLREAVTQVVLAARAGRWLLQR